MKKSKLFLATGALVLAVSAIFATKANKKFTFGVITGYSQSGTSAFALKTTGGNAWLTTHNATGSGFSPAIVTVVTTGNSIVFRTQLCTSTNHHLLYY